MRRNARALNIGMIGCQQDSNLQRIGLACVGLNRYQNSGAKYTQR